MTRAIILTTITMLMLVGCSRSIGTDSNGNKYDFYQCFDVEGTRCTFGRWASGGHGSYTWGGSMPQKESK